MRSKLGMKGSHTDSRKPFIEVVSGGDLHRKSGRWMKLERVIDREKDQYKEKVTNPQTGEIVHRCEELLSEHRGHGSARKRT